MRRQVRAKSGLRSLVGRRHSLRVVERLGCARGDPSLDHCGRVVGTSASYMASHVTGDDGVHPPSTPPLCRAPVMNSRRRIGHASSRFSASLSRPRMQLAPGLAHRTEGPFAAVHESESVKVFGRRPLLAVGHGRRPASENLQGTKPREGDVLGGAARSAMGIWPRRGHI
jgi:hypothetical protein